MDYKAKTAELKAQILRLAQIKEQLYSLEEEVLAIEKSVCTTDEQIGDSYSRSDEKLIELCERAYALIDELLGPPEDELQSQEKTIYLNDAVKKFS